MIWRSLAYTFYQHWKGLFAAIFFVRTSQKRISAAIPCGGAVNLFSAFIED
jgi:hypothetical protein